MIKFHKKDVNKQSGSKYFQNSSNTENTELIEGLNSMKIEKQKDSIKQIIASMTIGKDMSMLFPQVVKTIRTKNVELKKLVYLYLINYAKVKPDLTFLAVAAFNTDAKEGETALIRGLAIRTMGCIRVQEIVSYLCEILITAFKDPDAYVRKTAALCVAKLYGTSPNLVKENGFIKTLHDLLKDQNAMVIANAMAALNEISILSGVNQLKIKGKDLKKIIAALSEASEWGQVSILDALILYNPKKASYAEEVIDGVLPRLSHANPSVVLGAIKVILKFMDHIDNIDKVRNYCKKISNSLMSVMMSWPEIQYVLLRGLHAVVQKRPMLLDKDFKFFFIQYNDTIYVKLEKLDILYKLCDNKNFESIIKEFTSYALTEINTELIRKSVKYIGYIGYKFEKALDLCVESLQKIFDNNNDEAITEGVIVARDLMRKYKGRALELIKRINIDLINTLTDPESKSAAFYIIGEFCQNIPNSTEMITHFVDNFSSDETVSKIKLQILNAAVKNFVNKPEEGEEIVKICLQKGAEESENPDVRDRAYIYWRLLETDPDIAKDMMVSEKPPFEFNDEENTIEGDIIDDLVNNMTNASAVYLTKSKDLILDEDMILMDNKDEDKDKEDEDKDEDEENDKEKEKEKDKKEKNKEKDEDKDKDKEKEKEKKTKKKKKKDKNKNKEENQEGNNADLDLLGLDDEDAHQNNNNANMPQQNNNVNQNNNQQSAINDIFDIFNNMGGGSSAPSNNNNNNDFMFGQMNNQMNNQMINTIFQNSNMYPTTEMKQISSSNGVTIYSQFQRSNGEIQLGLFFQGQIMNNQCSLYFNKNGFGLTIPGNMQINNINNNIVFYKVTVDNNNNNMRPPSYPFILDGILNLNNCDFNLKIPLDVHILFIENFKFSGKPFVEFFSKNKDLAFNKNIYTYPKQNNEDNVKDIFERNNIYLSARQNKANPPTGYFSSSILGVINLLVECYMKNGQLNLRIIANHEAIVPLIKDSLDKILN